MRASPTRVASEFNNRYWGKSITPHTARNWLIGKSIPTQDKLRVLSDWLHVSPDVLRFGAPPATPNAAEPWAVGDEIDLVDRELIRRYLGLTPGDRKTVRDVVMALVLAAPVRGQMQEPSGSESITRKLEPLRY